MNKKQIFILCLIIYLIIVFVTEIFYRNKLYDKSVEYIENIKQDGFFHYHNNKIFSIDLLSI